MDDKTVDNAIEVAKSGSKALEHLTDLMNKIAGPLASEVGLMMGDKAHVYRVQNWIRCQRRIAEMLEEADAEPHEVPPRQFLPMLEASSLEDDATLQELWAALIANTATAEDELPSAFIGFLKELSPTEAEALRLLWQLNNEKFDRVAGFLAPQKLSGATQIDRDRTLITEEDLISYFKLAISNRTNMPVFEVETNHSEYKHVAVVGVANLVRLGILQTFAVGDRLEYSPKSFHEERYCFTPLGWLFVNSCQPPSVAVRERRIY